MATSDVAHASNDFTQQATLLTLSINKLGDHADQHVVGVETVVNGLELADSAAVSVDLAAEGAGPAGEAAGRRAEGSGDGVLVVPLGVKVLGLSVHVAQVSGVVISSAVQGADIAPKISPVVSVSAVLAAEAATSLQIKYDKGAKWIDAKSFFFKLFQILN